LQTATFQINHKSVIASLFAVNFESPPLDSIN
jgi:hypothetical protein